MDAQEEKIYSAIIITAIVLGIIIFYFFISIIRQQRRNLQLHHQNIMAEINTLEKERARMAADLHDDLGPLLTSIKFKISSIEAIDQEDQHQLDKASNEINALVNKLREIANNLMPATLTRKGLVIAVKEFVAKMKGSTNLNIVFKTNEVPQLHPSIDINTFRIVQEIVNNTIKHAQAGELKIEILANEKDVLLTCIDNGIGFNFSKASAENPGHGLRNLKSRTDIMGGKLSVESTPGKGTTYFFQIPLKTVNDEGAN